MRLFIALELDETVKDQLDHISNEVKQFTSKGRFTNKENLHLTIRFLGEVKADSVDELIKAIDCTANQVQPFALYLDSIGSFLKKQKHVISVGVSGQTDKLADLYKALETQLEGIGYQKEARPFNPHITLGRQVQLNGTVKDLQSEVTVSRTPIHVNQLSLMESTRVEGKLVYRPIYQTLFKGLKR
ncbi:RNA 2',3'-cyclic phosphodiesterase [Alkalibacterium sp. MB6]|uniref:RNA 2',3'-cyclic phosphodiesterase n=1 Tax=Alkalibacterium sp. MB6 TaxID=2081965 RepID=UPI00137ADF19|nr:RNA 2',3'-cyclic phosphodiesterase [Alkalibacterium sp. MB6]